MILRSNNNALCHTATYDEESRAPRSLHLYKCFRKSDNLLQIFPPGVLCHNDRVLQEQLGNVGRMRFDPKFQSNGLGIEKLDSFLGEHLSLGPP